jgi:hypothetical protein
LFDGDIALGTEDVLREEAEDAGFFEGDAVFGEELKDLGEGAVDIFGGGEGAGGFSEFGGDDGIGFGLGLMREAVRSAGKGEHTTAMAASCGESATRGMVLSESDFILELLGGVPPLFYGSM